MGDKLAFGMIASVVGAVFLFIFPLIGVIFGAFGGWAVGLFFEQTIREFLAAFGVDSSGLAIWQIGAGMGFFGAYLRSTHTSKER